MAFTITPVGSDRLADYASIPMIHSVRSLLAVGDMDAGLGGLSLREVPVDAPYVKDYDLYPECGPCSWPKRFDVSPWGFWLARDAGHGKEDPTNIHPGEPVGAAAVAWNTPEFGMLDGRSDIAVLLDIRVHEQRRRTGVGRALFNEAVNWAVDRGCTLLKVETQNVNVPACRFYSSMGCHLGEINRYAYAAYPEIAAEVMLVWYLSLT